LPCNTNGCGPHPGSSNFAENYFKENFLKIRVKVRLFVKKRGEGWDGREGRGQIYLILWLGEII